MAKQLPLGIRLNNPGLLVRSSDPWQGLAPVQRHRRFFTYIAPELGIRALARALITYQDKRRARDGSAIDTIREIIERWAPPIGFDETTGKEYAQDTEAYIEDVASDLGVSPEAVIDLHHYDTMRAIVVSIIEHENANYRYPAAVVDEGLRLAGVVPPAKVDRVATVALAAGGVGGVAGAVDLVGLAGSLNQAKDALAPAAETSTVVRGLVVALTLGVVAIGAYLVWRRYAQARAIAS
ncbi:MAG: hypothetical protein F9K32_16615 [Desulfobulbaceae bacterium]|nr:MAG: hypothetical protein F9K32_16615 [Desulfobulbaceae bacterium]